MKNRSGVAPTATSGPVAGSAASRATTSGSKSWAVRVLAALGTLGAVFVLQLLGRNKGLGLLFPSAGGKLELEHGEGPLLIRAEIPDAGGLRVLASGSGSGSGSGAEAGAGAGSGAGAGAETRVGVSGKAAEPGTSPTTPDSATTVTTATTAATGAVPRTERRIESGLYRPDTSRSLEHYAGAWLVHRRRLLDPYTRRRVKAIKSLEGASFSVAGMAAHQDPRITLMTRDYFDFSVQHLSSTTNQLPWGSTQDFLDVILEQTVGMVDRLEARNDAPRGHPTHISPLSDDARRTELTVALIPFCNRPASVEAKLESAWVNEFQGRVRLLFFQATFWSVFRAFPKIVVTVGTDADLATLLEMKLPVWKTINMKALFNASAPIRTPGSVHFLPKESLLFLIDKLQDPSADLFSRFQYVYYTEADHVLQLRSVDQLYDAIDNSGGRWAMAPHRLQTIAMPRLYPTFHQLWKSNPWQSHLADSLQHKRLIVEHEDPLGSCCDDGRFYFKPCGNWWYNCPAWGLRNFTDWVRFGSKGYTLPTGTEHAARCLYSEARKLCPVPRSGCAMRVPKSDADICKEVPHVEATFGWDPNAPPSPPPPPPPKRGSGGKPKPKPRPRPVNVYPA